MPADCRFARLMGLAAAIVAAPAIAQGADNGLTSGIAMPPSLNGKNPESRALYLSLIENMRRSGKAHAAIAHLDAFDAMYPRAEDAAVLRADCLVDLQDYAGASAIYDRLLRGRQAAAASAGLGRIDALGNRWPGAIDHYARAIALAPTMPAYLNDYGFALLRGGRAGDALFRLRQAAELAPADPRVRNNLVLALAATGDDAGARRLLAEIPDDAERAEIAAELAAHPAQAAAPPNGD